MEICMHYDIICQMFIRYIVIFRKSVRNMKVREEKKIRSLRNVGKQMNKVLNSIYYLNSPEKIYIAPSAIVILVIFSI